MKIRMEWINI